MRQLGADLKHMRLALPMVPHQQFWRFLSHFGKHMAHWDTLDTWDPRRKYSKVKTQNLKGGF